MTKEELKSKINDLCNLQIKNLERLTTNPEIPMEEIFARDSEISSEISKLRRELAKTTLFANRKSAKKFADQTTADIMSTVDRFMR